ncbi:MAG: hypothetical protein D6689_05485 [Deltaproteobacteria bacterium]|nr:MAG: hypothetical protein D6689_05485 [Deltaproteobacteria bacterium]
MTADRKMPAAIVVPAGGAAGAEPVRYEMFDATEVTAEGARLCGPVLLDVDDVVTLEVGGSGDAVRVRARVVKVTRDGGGHMDVRFVDVDQDVRRRLGGAGGEDAARDGGGAGGEDAARDGGGAGGEDAARDGDGARAGGGS